MIIKSQPQIPKAFRELFQPHRWKVYYGGRGGAKSHNFAQALLILGMKERHRILCCREVQKSLKQSVHSLLKRYIDKLNLNEFYEITDNIIRGKNGTEFIFAGLKDNSQSIKSTDGVTITWVEEAQTVSKASWGVLIPTVLREPGAEIWVSFNPRLDTDETYKKFVINKDLLTGSYVVKKVNFDDNPFIDQAMRDEEEALRKSDPDYHAHIWLGHTIRITEGAIFNKQLLAAEKEERITRCLYDASKPVYTAWDLGYRDKTCIVFWQFHGAEKRFIDYLEGQGEQIDFYMQELQKKGYTYDTHYLPHDGDASNIRGKSPSDQMRAKGFKVIVVDRPKDKRVPIEASRAAFATCIFDAEKCAELINGLRCYRFEVDPDRLDDLGKPLYSDRPLHDWASHTADAFHTFSMSLTQEKKTVKIAPKIPLPPTKNSWMFR